MALTDTAIRNVKAGPWPRKLTDGGGLYLLVTPAGAKHVRGALAPRPVRHHAAITVPKAVGALLRAIEGYEGEPVTRAALRLSTIRA